MITKLTPQVNLPNTMDSNDCRLEMAPTYTDPPRTVPTTEASKGSEAYGIFKLGSPMAYRFAGRIAHFVPRQELIEKVEQELPPGVGAHQIVILHGIPGQGKTQLALEFCHRSRNTKRYLSIFWIDASSRQSALQSFEKIWSIIKRPDQVVVDANDRLINVNNTMSEWQSPWLLVFDNYDNPRAFPNLNDFMPPGEHGSFLITSRHSGLDRLGHVISVGRLDEGAALTLLSRSSGIDFSHGNSADEDQAELIVERLGYLALAIDQAGAYIRGQNLELAGFIPEFESRKRTVMERIPDVWAYRKQISALSVYTTWELSFQLLDERAGGKSVKSRILTVFAFLDFRNISEELFSAPLISIDEFFRHRQNYANDNLTQTLQGDRMEPILRADRSWDLFIFGDVLEELSRLSLSQISTRSSGPPPDSTASEARKNGSYPGLRSFRHFSLHPLVSDWIKLRFDTQFECFLVALWVIASWVHWLTQADVGKYSISLEGETKLLSHLTLLESGAGSFVDLNQLDSPASWACSRIRSLRTSLTDFRSQKLVQKRRNTAAWLSSLDCQRRQRELSAYRTPGTGHWLLHHHAYESWVHHQGSLLWLTLAPVGNYLPRNVN